ncbi:MAG: 3'-5' exonuclease [Candidatus Xenobia bacterium]
MNFVISTTFLQSVTDLTPNEAAKVWEFVPRFHANPAHPSLSLERVVQALDKNVWSARIGSDIRAIAHKDGETWTLLYAGHHDPAYDWAARHKVERHIKTGALQIVALPETMQERVAQFHQPERPALFAHLTDDYLVSLGLPPSWLPTIRQVADDDVLLEVVQKLPEEVAERLLNVAAGELVTPPVPLAPERPALDSPDSQRRFYVIESDEELQRMLAAPLAYWRIFLHPSQRALVSGTYKGPVKVTGAAGTGKTVVAIHRARHLARKGRRVLLTTFIKTLCRDIETNLGLLCNDAERKRITVSHLQDQAREIVRQAGLKVKEIDDKQLFELIEKTRAAERCPYDATFLASEWSAILRPQGITSWDGYREASRAGRGSALSVKERKAIWAVFERVLETLQSRGCVEFGALFNLAIGALASGKVASPYDACIVDELQDLGPMELRFVAALAGLGEDRLMLVGDAGQRIFGKSFTLKSLGINVQGRSHVLRVNYRTTEQIRRLADKIVGSDEDDLEGGRQARTGSRSLLRGPQPVLQGFPSQRQECDYVLDRIRELGKNGLGLDEIAVFARTRSLLDPYEKALASAGIEVKRLEDAKADGDASVSLGTMHRSKGLEFKVVFAVDCGKEQLPSAGALRAAVDAAERDDVLRQERHLLYVTMTRGRDELFVLWTGEPSPFLAATQPAMAGGR